MEKAEITVRFHRENSALWIRNVLKVLFDGKALPDLFFGVSILLLTPNPGNCGKHAFITRKTALFCQN